MKIRLTPGQANYIMGQSDKCSICEAAYYDALEEDTSGYYLNTEYFEPKEIEHLMKIRAMAPKTIEQMLRWPHL